MTDSIRRSFEERERERGEQEGGGRRKGGNRKCSGGDKNLYRDVRLGRIVNSNRRVIGSIVKKRMGRRRREIQLWKKGEEGEEGSRGSAVLIIFYPKTAPSLRRAILLICKGGSEKWGGEE